MLSHEYGVRACVVIGPAHHHVWENSHLSSKHKLKRSVSGWTVDAAPVGHHHGFKLFSVDCIIDVALCLACNKIRSK